MSLYLTKILRGVTAGVATVAMAFQPHVLVAGQTAPVVKMPVQAVATAPAKAVVPVVQVPSDIVLQGKGVLLGRIVDARGQAVPNAPVTLRAGGKEVARVVSDKTGRFEAKNLKGGVYQVASVGHEGVYRLWAPQTAPPVAARGLSIVSKPVDIVRGQYAPGPGNPFTAAGQWIAEHPIMTAAGVAAAIAVPIALDDDDPPASP